MIRKPLPNYLFFIIALILLCIGYSPIWNGEFIGDDISRIEQFRSNISLSHYLNTGLGDRPLLMISVWFDRFFLKMSPGMMRLETLTIFALLLVLLRKIVIISNEKFYLTVNPFWRDLCLILFCVHPLHSQALTHVIQRGILLSTMGGMICTYWILLDEGDIKKPRTQLAFVVWLLALLCKPNIAFLPIFWLTLLYLLKKLENWKTIGIFVLMLAVPILNFKVGGFNAQLDAASVRDYFLTQGEVLALYFKLMILPIHLKFNHDIVAMPNTPWWPGIAWWSLFLTAMLLVWKKLNPKISAIFLIGGFLAFMPESSFFPISHASFEHRAFTPMCFFVISFALFPIRSLSKIFLFFATFIGILFIGLTYQRMQETKYFSHWSEKELSHSCKVEPLIFYDFAFLASRGHLEATKRVLDRISLCSPRPKIFPLLQAYNEFFISRKLDPLAFEVIKEWTHSDVELKPESRAMLNRLILTSFRKYFGKGEQACLKEDFLSNQMRELDREKLLLSTFFIEYAIAAKSCAKILGDKSDDDSKFTVIKIRAIMHTYFGVKDEELAKDLENSPAELRYENLRNLFIRKKNR